MKKELTPPERYDRLYKVWGVMNTIHFTIFITSSVVALVLIMAYVVTSSMCVLQIIMIDVYVLMGATASMFLYGSMAIIYRSEIERAWDEWEQKNKK